MGGRWLRLAFLLPGAAALVAITIDLGVAGHLPGGANDLAIDLAWYLTGAFTFIAASRNRAAGWLLAGVSVGLLGKAVGYSPLANPGAGWAFIVLVETFSWLAYWCVLGAFAVFPDGIFHRPYERWIVLTAPLVVVPLEVLQLAGLHGLTTHQLV